MKCPICGREFVERRSAFCSDRCQAIDLGRWLNGRYRIDPDTGEVVESEIPDTPPARK